MGKQTLAVAVLSARHPAPPLRARYAFTIDTLIAGPVRLLLDGASRNFRLRGREKKVKWQPSITLWFRKMSITSDKQNEEEKKKMSAAIVARRFWREPS